MRVAVVTTHVPFVRGGAEMLADGLVQAIRTAGHDADLVRVPFKWYPPECVLDHMVATRLLDLTASAGAPIDRVIALKFPAYLIAHPRKVLWLLHQHHGAYERWEHPLEDLHRHPLGPQVRAAIQQADRTALADIATRFAISATVAERLRRFCQLEAAVLYPPPPGADQLYCGDAADYVFFPSRLAPIKRQSLVLEALAHTREPVRVVFAGIADEPTHAAALRDQTRARGLEGRVEWLGAIDEREKRDRYAHALGVVFPPCDEDLGLVTLEAMAAAKPVVTCHDAGGPLELIRHEQTGLIAAATAGALAAALDALWRDRQRARAWGAAARADYQRLDIAWPTVVRRLLA